MTSQAVSDLRQLLTTMDPVLNEGTFVFATVPEGTNLDPTAVLASIREPEGLTVILEAGYARTVAVEIVFTCAWITLSVHSDLQAVGLTAAFSRALADVGISSNVVAGVYHDHIFVPVEAAQDAMGALTSLQQSSLQQSSLQQSSLQHASGPSED